MQSWRWYWRRLQRMSLPELGWRLGGVVRDQRLWWWQWLPVPTPQAAPTLAWCDQTPAIAATPYQAAAAAISNGQLALFGSVLNIGSPPQWQRCLKSGRRAPNRFGRLIDHRNAAQVGDVKYVWEPARHLHWVTLMQAWRLSGDAAPLATLRQQIDSWLDQNPYPRGIHWNSALEVAIRLINWALVWQIGGGGEGVLFADATGAQRRQRLLAAIYRQIHFVALTRSRHSSANNHLIGELSGLLIATSVWRHWPALQPLQQQVRRELFQQALRQSAPDGLNREQSSGYHTFVTTLLLLAGLCSRAAGHDLPYGYWQRLERMIVALAALIDERGELPAVGDSDDGVVVALTAIDPLVATPPQSLAPSLQLLLDTGAILFQRRELIGGDRAPADGCRWLLGDRIAQRRYAEAITRSPTALPQRWVESGWYLIARAAESEGRGACASGSAVRLLIDAAPLGYLSLAAHGHADALSIQLAIAGLPFLIDPGTYAYHTDPQWRAYFRGTAAHNTLQIGDLDQAVSGGNFLWVEHMRGRCEGMRERADGWWFQGSHDGWLRLPEPLRHRRQVWLARHANQIRIIDTLLPANRPNSIITRWRTRSPGVMPLYRHWHFAAGCQVSIAADGTTVAEQQGVTLRLSAAEPVTLHHYHGSEQPPRGWVSPRFDQRQSASTVSWQTPLQVGRALQTTICWS